MTRKDYELIAYAIKLSERTGGVHVQTPEWVQWHDTADCIADALQGDNPRFDRARFLAACGAES
jgi:hypothetical protein